MVALLDKDANVPRKSHMGYPFHQGPHPFLTVAHGRAVVKVLLGDYNKSPDFRWQLVWKYCRLQQFRVKTKSDLGEELWISQGLIRKQNPLENLK